MTDFEAYQEYIQRKHNAFCKAVIRYAARDKILQLRRKWERQISLDYLMDEKFVQFAGPEPDEEYPFTVCGQTVLLCNCLLYTSCVLENMMLAAHALGLGTVWVHREREIFDSESGKALLREWKLPETLRGVGAIALGYPAKEAGQPAARKQNYIVRI